MPGPKPSAINLNDVERQGLELLVRRYTTGQQKVIRARIVLFYGNTPMLASGIKGIRVQLENGSDQYSSACFQRGAPPPFDISYSKLVSCFWIFLQNLYQNWHVTPCLIRLYGCIFCILSIYFPSSRKSSNRKNQL